MKLTEKVDQAIDGIAARLISDYHEPDRHHVRLRYGIVAGWLTIVTTVILFSVRMILGYMAASVSVVADAFHLLMHLANAIVLLVSFNLAARPATADTPFGHGRMEYVAPLVMSVLLMVAGLQFGERAAHQVVAPHAIHYFPALPWILLVTILVKLLVGRISFHLGRRADSLAIQTTGRHQYIDAGVSLSVVVGLMVGHHFHIPVLDGYIGLMVAAFLIFSGFSHGHHALAPLLGKKPDPRLIEKIREISKSVAGVEDVHEIIVHDYGNKLLISLHVEVPMHLGVKKIHAVVEQCESKLRREFGGEVVGHADPRLEKTPEVIALEKRFRDLVDSLPWIQSYHNFRVIAESESRIILVSDINLAVDVPEKEYNKKAQELESYCRDVFSNLAYASFNVTPKFAF